MTLYGLLIEENTCPKISTFISMKKKQELYLYNFQCSALHYTCYMWLLSVAMSKLLERLQQIFELSRNCFPLSYNFTMQRLEVGNKQ